MESILTSAIVTGGAIYFGDIVLRPQFGTGMGEMIRFFVEGAIVNYLTAQFGGCKCSSGEASSFDVMRTIICSVSIFISDIVLRMPAFEGEGVAILKFMIQGFLVAYMVQYYDDNQ